jgi:putative Mg2+ transporter-C (MgtC) family protein
MDLSFLLDEFRDLPNLEEFLRVSLRLVAALLLGGAVGWERETAGKAAGMRTHMLVALGAALVMITSERMGMPAADQSRVIQGIVAGVGFLGGGAILKITDERKIRGLTTAAGIWMIAAIGIACGAGKLATAALAAVLAFLVLRVLHAFEERLAPGSGEAA